METIVIVIICVFILVALFFIVRAMVQKKREQKELERKEAEHQAFIEKTKAEIAENEAKIAKAQEELQAYYHQQKQLYDLYSPLVKDLVYDYSIVREDGVKAHLFHYEDKFTYILWQNEDGFEVSVHDMKDKSGLYYAYQETKDEFGKKFIMEVIDALTTFVAKIRLNGHGETNSLKEGEMNGYQSGYVAGYLRGQIDSINSAWELPEKDERLNDLKSVPNKIGNMQK